jgi:pimeloyl-ACP methyl ester carboxylesterase
MIRERRMQTGRCDMAWLEAGAGWPVLFVHGFPLNAGMWRPQLEQVPSGWRFIAPDLRGFGGTRARHARDGGGVSMDDYAADLADFMDSAAEDALIATVDGGYVAFALIARRRRGPTASCSPDTVGRRPNAAGREGRARMRDRLRTCRRRRTMLPKRRRRRPSGDPRCRRAAIGAEPAAIDAAIGAMMDQGRLTPRPAPIACACSCWWASLNFDHARRRLAGDATGDAALDAHHRPRRRAFCRTSKGPRCSTRRRRLPLARFSASAA